MFPAVVSLREMFSQFLVDINNTNRTTRTHTVPGRWYLSGEQEQVFHPR
jgi:hypothetical protein